MKNSKIRKLSIVLLGLIFLVIVSLGDLAHNHPLTQKENASCPAYVLSISINFEPALLGATALPSLTHLFSLQENYSAPVLILFVHSFAQRAPPQLYS